MRSYISFTIDELWNLSQPDLCSPIRRCFCTNAISAFHYFCSLVLGKSSSSPSRYQRRCHILDFFVKLSGRNQNQVKEKQLKRIKISYIDFLFNLRNCGERWAEFCSDEIMVVICLIDFDKDSSISWKDFFGFYEILNKFSYLERPVNITNCITTLYKDLTLSLFRINNIESKQQTKLIRLSKHARTQGLNPLTMFVEMEGRYGTLFNQFNLEQFLLKIGASIGDVDQDAPRDGDGEFNDPIEPYPTDFVEVPSLTDHTDDHRKYPQIGFGEREDEVSPFENEGKEERQEYPEDFDIRFAQHPYDNHSRQDDSPIDQDADDHYTRLARRMEAVEDDEYGYGGVRGVREEGGDDNDFERISSTYLGRREQEQAASRSILVSRKLEESIGETVQLLQENSEHLSQKLEAAPVEDAESLWEALKALENKLQTGAQSPPGRRHVSTPSWKGRRSRGGGRAAPAVRRLEDLEVDQLLEEIANRQPVQESYGHHSVSADLSPVLPDGRDKHLSSLGDNQQFIVTPSIDFTPDPTGRHPAFSTPDKQQHWRESDHQEGAAWTNPELSRRNSRPVQAAELTTPVGTNTGIRRGKSVSTTPRSLTTKQNLSIFRSPLTQQALSRRNVYDPDKYRWRPMDFDPLKTRRFDYSNAGDLQKLNTMFFG